MEYLNKVKVACLFNHYTFDKLANKLQLTAEELTNELVSGNITVNRLNQIAKCLGICFNGWFVDKVRY